MQQISAENIGKKHGLVGKLINWELCKRIKFETTNEWYMLKPEFVPETEAPRILLDLEIQVDHSIPARKPDLVLTTRKELIIWRILKQSWRAWKNGWINQNHLGHSS